MHFNKASSLYALTFNVLYKQEVLRGGVNSIYSPHKLWSECTLFQCPLWFGKFTRVYEITCTLMINNHFFLKQILHYFSAVIYDILANIRLRILMLLGPGSCSIGSKTFYDRKLFCRVGTVDHFHPSPIFVKKAENSSALAPNIRLGWIY
jgi:hypothetical protein